MASWVAKKMKVPHVSTGNIFRQEIASRSEMGRLVNRFISRGQLVADEVVIHIVENWLQQSGTRGFVFDGFPRTLPQAQLFQDLLGRHSTRLDGVVYLRASWAEVLERVLGRLVCEDCDRNFHIHRHPPRQEGHCDGCGGKLTRREDDTQEIAQKRWSVFEKQSVGLLEFYRDLGILHEVGADGDVEEMCQQVWKMVMK